MNKVYGLIGCPVGHSMSPLIHNDQLQHKKISAAYHAFHVEKEHLKAAVEGARALGIAGFNVTIPHKISIIPFLDELDQSAELLGAVNTVLNKEGRLIGYNTDGQGYLASLKQLMEKPLHEQRYLIIGAGGAARAIFYTLASEGASAIDLANRTPEKARMLMEECPHKVDGNVFSLSEAESLLSDYDVIIQTTAIGMHPNETEKPFAASNIRRGTIVSDIVYNPVKTAFLTEAEKAGARILNGVGMFVYQAALSFEIWTGEKPDTARMSKLVFAQLGGNSC
ncbi:MULTISPECIES: shikimate dehydrogenase [Metabacillus]|uniref:Shikimate dehydrogenase (NADP(+)) n=1 Tax=Metabacillus indicus TaxID=246786 RepID=A0A084GWS4_METID|nr:MULTISPECIES: shikimate dehydrogenase [Metabacillus]KEZ51097.1 shikimate dehydrogenase [Metabacillus indicus LMG 22858]KEZ51786.1 shikimate dehydrogenase [Metabacillus indicus]